MSGAQTIAGTPPGRIAANTTSAMQRTAPPKMQTAMAVSRAMQIQETLREGSTDSNVPMNLGIPAITISGGGIGTGAHSLNEAFTTTESWRGTERALLLAVALAR